MCEIQTHHKAPITFLRSLKARCCWAAAHDGADPESGDGCAHEQAYSQGIHDFQSDRAANDIPPLLADLEELARAWQAGWEWAEDVEAMASCRYCQDVYVDVCHVHG